MVRATALRVQRQLVVVSYGQVQLAERLGLVKDEDDGIALTGMWHAMQQILEWVDASYAMIVSSCTLWQPSAQNQ